MRDWRRNKWVGVVMGIITLICIGLALFPFIKSSIENKKAALEGQKWLEKERQWMKEGK